MAIYMVESRDHELSKTVKLLDLGSPGEKRPKI